MQTKSQKYAALIYRQVTEINEKSRVKYGSWALRLPYLVRRAGLQQALAYVHARSTKERSEGEEAGLILLDHLAHVLGFSNREALLQQVRTADLRTYMRFTREALAALEWYRRFAQSVLKVDHTVAMDAGSDIR
ncbi:MAG: CRISPR-associated RAMP Cmr5 [Hydrogenibacillus schlegelii]|uniref:CRISPR type III-B/RAMP module-associated protein Cmr5 n=1 Tax=Hydrogenibacillus schlegelii TaxID=1484 RepID=A0A2T5G6R7_HYDSH|nr:type III-B CRISPR module-associated protein Cmr5 [Hydrogenibacillus schlegelii]PTQ51862.1 MAG: CRISPR-associated RAMP Cmr5 [Hydrogenibacillus schlegelii]